MPPPSPSSDDRVVDTAYVQSDTPPQKSRDESGLVDSFVDSSRDQDDMEEEAEGESNEFRRVDMNNPDANAARDFCSNVVVTSRFTLYNFLPKLLFHEFSKLANAYFLIISIMQTIEPISNTGGFPASLPALSIIVAIDMFFACLEDYKRHKADNVANERPCQVFDRHAKAFVDSKWRLINVGDVLKVHNREPIPADVVILGACEPEPTHPAGICYVETKSLDGETNLKLRQGVEATYPFIKEDADVAQFQGHLTCEHPNNSIHRFSGTLTMASGKQEVVTTNAIALRGSTLRNTEFMYGLVVNTGAETKIMMAAAAAPIKWSNMERKLNEQILYICCLMVVLCLTGATLSAVWNAGNLGDTRPKAESWYLYDNSATAVSAPVGDFFIQVLYYFLLLNSFIPVSLYVSMTSVKFLQAFFMNKDLDMYHAESDTPCQVRTMSLNEELGQIDYIFSDKTGTLTCNVMEFRKCSINGVAYGHGDTEIGRAAKKRQEEEGLLPIGQNDPILEETSEDEAGVSVSNRRTHRLVQAPFVNYQDDSIFDALSKPHTPHCKVIQQFFEHLAVCHTVMVEKSSDGEVRLSASSPDEQALVAAAGSFGYKFVARSPGRAFVERVPLPGFDQEPSGERDAYEVLEVLEFNSTRKRMSVILQDPSGSIRLLCKGADSVMYERLREAQTPQERSVRKKTLEHMERFATEGLRTLVIASSEIDKDFYLDWVKAYRSAINDMQQIELRRRGEENEIDRRMEQIEVNLQILGATAIEDRLQEHVPDTIFKLREASIKVWMLTGDKEETAINIGYACRLLSADMDRIVISAESHPDLDSIVEELERYTRDSGTDEEDASGLFQQQRHLRRLWFWKKDPQETTLADRGNRLTRLESLATMHATQKELALVIDGETLELVLEERPELLMSVAEQCVAVIACRVSPAQKAQLVQLVRKANPALRTLAIGDGANDVSMIQSAHVGVGISGQEGMQAANSADYSIAQFRFLSRLLFVHGRWNYIRMSTLILYIFYKNVMMNLTQYWYMLYTGFSGQKFFLEWGLQGYNLLYTALPIILVGTFEQDVPAYLADAFPMLYRVGQENRHFNTQLVIGWIVSCIWESLVISFGTLYGMQYLVNHGETPNMWVYGCTAFTIVVLVVTLKLCLRQEMWWPLHVPLYVLSFALWIVTAAIISYGSSVNFSYWNGVFPNTFGEGVFWLLVPLLTLTALSRDFFWKGYTQAFRPSYKHLAQEVHSFQLSYMAHKLLTFPPPDKIPSRQDLEAEGFDLASPTASPRTGFRLHRPLVKPFVSSWRRMMTVASMNFDIPYFPRDTQGQRSRQKNATVSRGNAFSYDAESVMVEAYMAGQRYNGDHDSRSQFERHASRGSIAFHSFNDSGKDDRHEEQHSAGNVFQASKHIAGRRHLRNMHSAGSNLDANDETRANAHRRNHSTGGQNNSFLRGRGLRAMSSDDITRVDEGPRASNQRVRRYSHQANGSA